MDEKKKVYTCNSCTETRRPFFVCRGDHLINYLEFGGVIVAVINCVYACINLMITVVERSLWIKNHSEALKLNSTPLYCFVKGSGECFLSNFTLRPSKHVIFLFS